MGYVNPLEGRLWSEGFPLDLLHLGTACNNEAEEEATAALSAMLGLGKPKVGGTWDRNCEVDGKMNTCSSTFFRVSRDYIKY